MHRSSQHCRSSRLRSISLVVHIELGQHVLGISQHVHQMRNWGTLVTPDITDAALQQGLGDREDPLAAELFSCPESQFLDFLFERAFSHECQSCRWPAGTINKKAASAAAPPPRQRPAGDVPVPEALQKIGKQCQ